MAEEQKHVETESPPEAPPALQEAVDEPPKDVTEEKSVIQSPTSVDKPDDSKALLLVDKASEPVKEKSKEGSLDRDAALARVESEKKMSLIKAWEENEKSKTENKAHKKLSSIGAWENSKNASIEFELKKIEESLEKKKAEYAEKMRNKIALIHKAAEEKRANVEAKREGDLLKAQEVAAKCRATGHPPKKLFGWFWG